MGLEESTFAFALSASVITFVVTYYYYAVAQVSKIDSAIDFIDLIIIIYKKYGSRFIHKPYPESISYLNSKVKCSVLYDDILETKDLHE